MAFLNSGITITLRDEGAAKSPGVGLLLRGGVKHFVQYLNRTKEALFPEPIYQRQPGRRGNGSGDAVYDQL